MTEHHTDSQVLTENDIPAVPPKVRVIKGGGRRDSAERSELSLLKILIDRNPERAAEFLGRLRLAVYRK